MVKKRLPPLSVLNNIFITGGVDAGMSGCSEWSPFTISTDEYLQLVNYCNKNKYHIIEAPEWVQTLSDFQVLEFEIDSGVPPEEHKKLSDAESKAQAELKKSVRNWC